MKKPDLKLAAVLAACILQTAASGATPPLIAGDPILIPDSHGKFDFIETDPQTSRLLATHTGNKTLDIFDSVSGSLVKQCPTGASQGVAIDGGNGK